MPDLGQILGNFLPVLRDCAEERGRLEGGSRGPEVGAPRKRSRGRFGDQSFESVGSSHGYFELAGPGFCEVESESPLLLKMSAWFP